MLVGVHGRTFGHDAPVFESFMTLSFQNVLEYLLSVFPELFADPFATQFEVLDLQQRRSYYRDLSFYQYFTLNNWGLFYPKDSGWDSKILSYIEGNQFHFLCLHL